MKPAFTMTEFSEVLVAVVKEYRNGKLREKLPSLSHRKVNLETTFAVLYPVVCEIAKRVPEDFHTMLEFRLFKELERVEDHEHHMSRAHADEVLAHFVVNACKPHNVSFSVKDLEG